MEKRSKCDKCGIRRKTMRSRLRMESGRSLVITGERCPRCESKPKLEDSGLDCFHLWNENGEIVGSTNYWPGQEEEKDD